jgi:hypothetical protein
MARPPRVSPMAGHGWDARSATRRRLAERFFSRPTGSASPLPSRWLSTQLRLRSAIRRRLMPESLDGREDASRGGVDRREPKAGRGGGASDPANPPVPSPDPGDPRGRGLGPQERSYGEDRRLSGALEFCIGSIVIDIDPEVSPTSD